VARGAPGRARAPRPAQLPGSQPFRLPGALYWRGPRLGDLEAGTVATAFGDTVSGGSGGLACIAGALVLAWALPGFTRLRSALHEEAGDLAGAAAPANSVRSPAPHPPPAACPRRPGP
jgi:hypothetical protein